jgi:hypothetical protein
MLKGMRLLSLVLLVSSTAAAHDVITTKLTYARDISRIFEKRCLECHGQNASIPLTSYAEIRPWAVGIKEQVLSRSMPPWGAVKGFGNLASDGALTQEEIMIIAAWVIGGAPEGDRSLLSKPIVKAPVNQAPNLRDALNIETRTELKEPLTIAGIRPLSSGKVDSVRIVAKYPDGRIEPLLWLYQFDPKAHGAFSFRSPINLPAKSVIEASAPLAYALEAQAR